MRIIGPHPDHGCAEALIEQQVVGQVCARLERHADHRPGAGLIADFLEVVQALQAPVVGVQAVVGMYPAIEVGVAGLDPEEVPVRAGGEPFLVDFPGLLAQREGDPQGRVVPRVDGLDGLDQAGDLVDEGPVLPLPALDDDGTVAALRSHGGRLEDLPVAQFVAGAVHPAADAAIQAVLGADVRDLDESAQIDDGAHGCDFC